ncbi:hypothetical protein CEXT_563321 [Caerostris extrusa]|uniref:Uncharacterized protein n=1 Tax=Caerostris extrusa TaxID=172846 RepID=A0AAV4UJM6_CAEEX|nr:hypothetical protein CEXT_563321 [Caerostris extrusa]
MNILLGFPNLGPLSLTVPVTGSESEAFTYPPPPSLPFPTLAYVTVVWGGGVEYEGCVQDQVEFRSEEWHEPKRRGGKGTTFFL